jgi:hypothetical protein
VLTNNIFIGFTGYSYGGASVDSAETYNDYYDYWGENGTPPSGTGNVSLDPLFVDAAAGDFHLLVASPIADLGTYLTEVRYDQDGVERVAGQVSIGAYEQD